MHMKIGEPLLHVDHITLSHFSKPLWQVHVSIYNVVQRTRLHYFADYMLLADFSSSLHYTGNSVFLAFLASLVSVARF
jgi:hypothetical protein